MRWNSEHLAGVEFEFPFHFRLPFSSRTLSSTALSTYTLIDSCCEGRLIQHPTVMDTLPNRQNHQWVPLRWSTWFRPNVVWWFRGGFAVWCWRCLKFKGIHISKGLYLNDYIVIITWGLTWNNQPHLVDDFLVELVAWSWGPSSRASQGKLRPWSKADGLMLMDLGLLYLPVGK